MNLRATQDLARCAEYYGAVGLTVKGKSLTIPFCLDTKFSTQYEWAVNFEKQDRARSSLRDASLTLGRRVVDGTSS